MGKWANGRGKGKGKGNGKRDGGNAIGACMALLGSATIGIIGERREEIARGGELKELTGMLVRNRRKTEATSCGVK
jgi:hypothetical protein